MRTPSHAMLLLAALRTWERRLEQPPARSGVGRSTSAGLRGFEKLRDTPFGDGGRWLEVVAAGATTTIAPMSVGDEGCSSSEVSFTTDHVGAAHEALRARSVDADPELMRFGENVPSMSHRPGRRRPAL